MEIKLYIWSASILICRIGINEFLYSILRIQWQRVVERRSIWICVCYTCNSCFRQIDREVSKEVQLILFRPVIIYIGASCISETPILRKRLLSSLGFLLVLMYISMGHNMLSLPLPMLPVNTAFRNPSYAAPSITCSWTATTPAPSWTASTSWPASAKKNWPA